MPAYNYYNVPNWQPVQQPGFNYFPPQQSFAMPVQNSPQYMIQVDGEIGAKAWQPQTPLNPNTVIPLWDFDGMHVYFKSTDAYGRMNPVRKAKVVFEDEPQSLPQGNSGSVENIQNVSGNSSGSGQTIEMPDMTRFATKDDLESLKQDLRSMFTAQAMRGESFQANENSSYEQGNSHQKTNQNGNYSKGGNR